MIRHCRRPFPRWLVAMYWLCLVLFLLTPDGSSTWTAAAPSSSSLAASPLAEYRLANSILRSLEGGMRATRRIPHSMMKKSMNALSSNKQQPLAVQDLVSKRFSVAIPPELVNELKRKLPGVAGYFYGLQPDKYFPYTHHPSEKEATQLAMSQALTETLEELKTMRQELKALRREMLEMRKKITGEQDLDYLDEEEKGIDPEVVRLAQLKRQRKFERIGKAAERWAHRMLFEEERAGEGWVEVACNRALQNSYNANDRTQVYLAWLKDSRENHADATDDREHPCIKVYSIIDAPLEDVCSYLSQEQRLPEYNDIITAHRDLEEIAPYAKICWAVSPQILFLKPRDFVTYVFHKWSRDGNTLAMVNQAVEHEQAPAVKEEGVGKTCRAYALRGATFISRDPENPDKTRFSMIAHAAAGGGIPQWACKTAVNAMAPLEPYKLFHKINQNVMKAKPELAALRLEHAQEISDPGRCSRPAGMAQIGWAAFWPNGGAPLPRPPSEDDRSGNNGGGGDHPESEPQPTMTREGTP